MEEVATESEIDKVVLVVVVSPTRYHSDRWESKQVGRERR